MKNQQNNTCVHDIYPELSSGFKYKNRDVMFGFFQKYPIGMITEHNSIPRYIRLVMVAFSYSTSC